MGRWNLLCYQGHNRHGGGGQWQSYQAVMALLLQVKWVEQSARPGPYQRIKHIGGDSGQLLWKHTQAEAVESIERGWFVYYLDQNSGPVRLGVAQAADGGKYLTVNSGRLQMLLDLPEFPKLSSAGKGRC